MNAFINIYGKIKKKVVIIILISGIRDANIENEETPKIVEELLKTESI